MYQNAYITAALAEQRQADLLAQARRDRDLRLAKAARGRLRPRRRDRQAAMPAAPTSAKALATA